MESCDKEQVMGLNFWHLLSKQGGVQNGKWESH